MNPEQHEIVKRYLAGDIDLESAAHDLHSGGEYGLYYSPGTIPAEDQERIEALLGRQLWLGLGEANPDGVPDQPFGAEDFRALANGTFFDSEPGEQPKGMNDPDPDGAPQNDL